MPSVLESKISTLPSSPGVYLMKDRGGRIIYIGKAKSLKERVRAYLTGSDERAFVSLLEHMLADVEVILTHNPKEALLLENELIKEHQPRFNVKLTDDSRYLCLRLDTSQTYPRLEAVRQFRRDGARYFGPYHSAIAIRETMRIINRHFQLRTCSDHVLRNRSRPCLQYQIKRCPAPCVYDLSADGSYQANVKSVVSFLDGHSEALLADLERRMKTHAAATEFEAAAVLRDQIEAVRRSMQRQQVVTTDFVNRDVLGIYREGPAVELHVMRVRDGRLVDAKRFSFTKLEQPTDEILTDFAVQYYSEADIPDEILFPSTTAWATTLGQVLSEKTERKVEVQVPRRGHKHRLAQMAMRNAQQAFVDKQRQAASASQAIAKLQQALHLKRPPERLECFDISHLGGEQIVASAVRLHEGVAQKALYRHYTIRSTSGQDDFQSMYEVISRRARRGLEQDDLPDLLVIDGGKGQLNAARAALEDHGIDSIDIIGLAKGRLESGAKATQPQADASSSAGGIEVNTSAKPERIFLAGRKDPVVLKQDSAELFLLTRARDEAHRFAITFHRKKRRKALTKSALDTIPGVGPKRRQALLKAFGSVARIKKASRTEVAKVVGDKLAQVIANALADSQK